MRHFRLISRLKTYQAGAMILSLPPLSYWYHLEMITGNSLAYGFVATGGAVAMLSLLSYIFSRFVGEIQYNEKDRMIKVSHLNFFGIRQNLIVEVDDIVPFQDLHCTEKGIGLFQRLQFGNKTLYYSLKYGYVKDRKGLNEVLSY